MADVSPEGVELRAAQLVITRQDLFDLLHLWRGFEEPGADSLFLDALDAKVLFYNLCHADVISM